MRTRSDPISKVRWLECKNNSGSLVIPAFGLVRVVSVDTDGVLTVDRPSTDSEFCLVNGPTDIAASGYGACTNDFPVHALYETGDGTPTGGQEWGAGASSYKLRSGKAGFRILGGVTSGRVVVARPLAAGGGLNGFALEGPNQSIPNNTNTLIVWPDEIHDDGGYFDSATPNKITFPATGYYVLTASIWTWDFNVAGYRAIQFVPSTYSHWIASSGLNIPPNTLTATMYAASGSQLQVQVFQNSGVALNAYSLKFNGARIN